MDPQSNRPDPSSFPVKIQHLSASGVQKLPSSAISVPVLAELPHNSGAAFAGPLLSHGSAAESVIVSYWRKVGGGSFMVSLLVHAVVIAGAFFIVETVVTHEPPVDFITGSSSASAQVASQQLSEKVQSRRSHDRYKATPFTRITVSHPDLDVVLPDAPVESIALPQASAFMGAGATGGPGFGKSGIGEGIGPGTGVGPGSMKGFLARTVFGNLGSSEGLPGTLYDLKQDAERKPLSYTPNEYFPTAKRFADSKFKPSAMNDYYRAPQQMSFTFLTIPYMAAEEGPKAFNVEKEVQPRGWLVHYTGTIIPPENGEWRFLGNFDDALAVYINDKPVLDASWATFVNLGERQPDQEVRQPFGGPPVLTSAQRLHAGKWVRLNGPAKIDIVIGERPGGYVGGLLLVQHKKTKYRLRADETPILPVFTTVKPDQQDLERMKKFTTMAPQFEIETDHIPVFAVSKSTFDPDGKGVGLLPPR